MERRYKTAMSYGKEKVDGNLIRTNKRTVGIERSGPNIVCTGIKITMDEMARAADMGVRRNSTANLALKLVETLRVGTTVIFLAVVSEVAAEWSRSVLDTERRLVFVKSGYLMR